ncbi:MAG: FAD-dependent oxidoreductase [Chthoniobacteraceae bacterium]
MQKWDINPGNGTVGRLCHEFRVSVAVLEAMLSPYIASGLLVIAYEYEPIHANVAGDSIESVTVRHIPTGRDQCVSAAFVIDATETGDILPLAGVEYVTGFESRAMTGEPSARDNYEPDNMQAVSWCFAIDHIADEEHVIDKPGDYDFWRSCVPDLKPAWGSPFLSWSATHPRTMVSEEREFFQNETRLKGDRNLWTFRRIIDRSQFKQDFYQSDIVLVNWPQIDYLLGSIIDVSQEEKEKHLKGSRQLALSMLYWMQTEAPRHDGSSGVGYPGLRLRPDVTGYGPDGLALHAYIRESRRIKAKFTVCEQPISLAIRGKNGSEFFPDTVGIGHYNIDLHPSTGGDNYIDVEACPFQIPLGSLIPVRVRNLLAGGKNLGVTRITNGCYRLHPIEWNIGEAVGVLAAYWLNNKTIPESVYMDKSRLGEFQLELSHQGFVLEWPGRPYPFEP